MNCSLPPDDPNLSFESLGADAAEGTDVPEATYICNETDPTSLELLLSRAAAFGQFDEDIARLVAAGNLEAATAAIIDEWGQTIFGMLDAYLCRSPDTPDVFQKFCLRLPNALGTFHWKCPLRNRVMRTAFSVAKSHVLQSRGNQDKQVPFDTGLAARVAIDPASFDAGVLRDVQRLNCALRKLDALTRAILIARGDGYSWPEIAEMLSDEETRVTAASALKRYQRALNEKPGLREHYDALPVECGTAACACGKALTAISGSLTNPG